jgi:hypothetical protein
MSGPVKLLPMAGKAVGPAKAGNTFRDLKRLAELADAVITRLRSIEKIQKGLWELERALETEQPRPEIDLKGAELSQSDLDRVNECNRLLAVLDPLEHYEGDDRDHDVRPKVVAARLALLVGCMNVGKNQEIEVYSGMLLEHVTGLDSFSYLALADACREIEATKKFADIAEIVEAITRHSDLWNSRTYAIQSLHETSTRVLRRIERLRPEIDADEARRKAQAAAYRLSNIETALGITKNQAVAKQVAAAKAAQEVAAALVKLAEQEAKLAEAIEAKRVADAAMAAIQSTMEELT